MNWITATQLAGEIVDIVGIEKVSAAQQEQIATFLQQRDGQKFNNHSQKWAPTQPTRVDGAEQERSEE